METHGTCPPSGDSSFKSSAGASFKMIDVGEKLPTHRRAIACGKIQMASATLKRIAEKTMPKGDVLALAEVAGIMAAKRTSDLLPLCHPLPLDAVRVFCEIDESAAAVLVKCEASATAKTGVEMEALAGVSAALLSIYDLTKGIDPVLSISDIHLKVKEGGKSGRWVHPIYKEATQTSTQDMPKSFKDIRAAVITISDRCSSGNAEDRSGPVLRDFLQSNGAEVVSTQVIPDEKGVIQNTLRRMTLPGVDLIVTTGGTGLSPRDVTPEALSELWTRTIPGIGELLRSSGAQHNTRSWLSRSEAGLIGKTLVIVLPGNMNAVREGMDALKDLLPHAIHIVRGGAH